MKIAKNKIIDGNCFNCYGFITKTPDHLRTLERFNYCTLYENQIVRVEKYYKIKLIPIE